MPYDIKPLPCDPARLNGLSEKLIVSHWENNYSGAVKRLNAIEQKLAQLDWSTAPVFEVNGLKREEMIASGSMILHEVYFDSLGGGGGDPSGMLKAAIERDFGSLDAWRGEFTAMGKAQGGGSGWTLLVWSPRRARLVNAWAADHAHNLAGAMPLLALDMYEHSYQMDFGAKAGAYVEAFMNNLSWTAAEAAFNKIGA
jgi:Fe-Mn family superoxide dismutase